MPVRSVFEKATGISAADYIATDRTLDGRTQKIASTHSRRLPSSRLSSIPPSTPTPPRARPIRKAVPIAAGTVDSNRSAMMSGNDSIS